MAIQVDQNTSTEFLQYRAVQSDSYERKEPQTQKTGETEEMK